MLRLAAPFKKQFKLRHLKVAGAGYWDVIVMTMPRFREQEEMIT